VPESFRFSAKLPKTVTHQAKLVGCAELVAAFVEEVAPLARGWTCCSSSCRPSSASTLRWRRPSSPTSRRATRRRIACEPRHPSWFDDGADALLARLEVARVAADPAVVR
jgi:uncharacterized protein YecE (DUF72 family)